MNVFLFSYPIRVAKAIGTLAQYNFAFLMIPVTRTSILLHVFRISFENVIIFHRWLGRWVSKY